MTDLHKLQALLEADPDRYASATDTEAAALANEPRHVRAVETLVQYRLLSALLPDLDSLRRLIRTVDQVVTEFGDPLIAMMRNYLEGESGIDVSNPRTQAVLTAWGLEPLLPLTSADAAAVIALAVSETLSDADVRKLPPVRPGDVAKSRRMMAADPEQDDPASPENTEEIVESPQNSFEPEPLEELP